MVGWKQMNLSGQLADTKTATLNMIGWPFTLHMKPDVAILWCVSKNGKNIERGYIIPKGKIDKTSITIVKNPSKGGWYEHYRITDEEFIKKANKIWQKIILG